MLQQKLTGGVIFLLLGGLLAIILVLALIFGPTNAPNSQSENPIQLDPITLEKIPVGFTLFEIQPFASEARFILDEVLRGNPKTVVGSSGQVGGQILVNYDDLPTVQFSQIGVLAETLNTDNSFRDSALRERILFTNQYELITFEPTSFHNLPESIQVGHTIEFDVTGTLSIKGIGREETFSVVATAVSATQFNLFASTQINRLDYDLIIPAVQGVANVDEIILIELDLVAAAVE